MLSTLNKGELDQVDLNKKTVKQLKKICREFNIKRFQRLKKKDLIEVLYNHIKKGIECTDSVLCEEEKKIDEPIALKDDNICEIIKSSVKPQSFDDITIIIKKDIQEVKEEDEKKKLIKVEGVKSDVEETTESSIESKIRAQENRIREQIHKIRNNLNKKNKKEIKKRSYTEINKPTNGKHTLKSLSTASLQYRIRLLQQYKTDLTPSQLAAVDNQVKAYTRASKFNLSKQLIKNNKDIKQKTKEERLKEKRFKRYFKAKLSDEKIIYTELKRARMIEKQELRKKDRILLTQKEKNEKMKDIRLKRTSVGRSIQQMHTYIKRNPDSTKAKDYSTRILSIPKKYLFLKKEIEEREKKNKEQRDKVNKYIKKYKTRYEKLLLSYVKK